MNDRRQGVLRQIFPAQEPDRLGMLFMDVFYSRYDILQVPIDAPGRIPGNQLQLPEFLSQINVSPALKGSLDRQQDSFESSLSLGGLYAGLSHYRGYYRFFSRARHHALWFFACWRLRSVSLS